MSASEATNHTIRACVSYKALWHVDHLPQLMSVIGIGFLSVSSQSENQFSELIENISGEYLSQYLSQYLSLYLSQYLSLYLSLYLLWQASNNYQFVISLSTVYQSNVISL